MSWVVRRHARREPSIIEHLSDRTRRFFASHAQSHFDLLAREFLRHEFHCRSQKLLIDEFLRLDQVEFRPFMNLTSQ
jgi:hypothetical protein